MKMFAVVALALVACAAAAPPRIEDEAKAQVLRSAFNQDPEGSYKYNVETDNGIKLDETGELKPVLDEKNESHNVVVVRGSYSYVDPQGQEVVINYVADETGFHAEGPTVPKVPARR